METSADRYVLVLHSVDEVACRRWTDRHDRWDDSGQQGDSSLTIAELVALFCTGGKSAFWWVRAMETPIVQWKGSCVQWKGRGMQWKGFPGAMESWFSQQLLPPHLRGEFLLYLNNAKAYLEQQDTLYRLVYAVHGQLTIHHGLFEGSNDAGNKARSIGAFDHVITGKNG